MAGHQNLAGTHRHGSANDADQRRFARPVWPKQRENLAFLDREIDRIERQFPGRIALGDRGG